MKKFLWWLISIVIAGGLVFCYFHFYYVFGDGTLSGELNKLEYKGYVFKTYEGNLILTGYGNRSGKAAPTVQSNEFKFSVANKEVAKILQNSTGSKIKVHYKQYFGALPWRGYEKNIVDAVTVLGESDVQPTVEEEMFL